VRDDDHPRSTFRFTPGSASRLNAAEGFFWTIRRGRIRRGVVKSIAGLDDALARSIEAHNPSRPFVWAAFFQKSPLEYAT